MIADIQKRLFEALLQKAVMSEGRLLEPSEFQEQVEEQLGKLGVANFGSPFLMSRKPHNATLTSEEYNHVTSFIEFDLATITGGFNVIVKTLASDAFAQMYNSCQLVIDGLGTTAPLITQMLHEYDFETEPDKAQSTVVLGKDGFELPYVELSGAALSLSQISVESGGSNATSSASSVTSDSSYFTAKGPLVLRVNFNELTYISIIKLALYEGSCNCYWSNDGYNFTAISMTDGEARALLGVRAIRLEFTGTSIKANSLQVIHAKPKPDAVLYMRPWAPEYAIEKLALSVKEIVPADASIVYYLAYADPYTTPANWLEIDPVQRTPDAAINTGAITLSSAVHETGSYAPTVHATAGKNLYYLGLDLSTISTDNLDKLIIYGAYNQANVTSFAYNWNYVTYPLEERTMLRDMRLAFSNMPYNARLISEGVASFGGGIEGLIAYDGTQHVINLKNGASGGLGTDTSSDYTYKLSLVLHSQKISTKRLAINTDQEVFNGTNMNTYFQIYLNGELIAANESSSIEYRINEGANILDIYAIRYANANPEEGYIPLGINLTAGSDDLVEMGITRITGQPNPLPLVSLHELVYLVPFQSRKHATLYLDGSEGYRIMLAYDPSAVASYDNQSGHTTHAEKFYIEYPVVGASIDYIWLKAELFGEETSPLLKSIGLIKPGDGN